MNVKMMTEFNILKLNKGKLERVYVQYVNFGYYVFINIRDEEEFTINVKIKLSEVSKIFNVLR